MLAATVSVASWNGYDFHYLMPDAHVGRGELWRVVTSALPHVNFAHLLFNVWWLWDCGTLVESFYGPSKTGGMFLLLAAVSGSLQYALSDGGIGLSGVGYGLFGFLWLRCRAEPRLGGPLDKRTVAVFVLWFFACIVTTMTGMMRVGNVAHGAGAVAGILLALSLSRKAAVRRLAATATVLLAAAGLLGATVARPWVNLSSSRGLDEADLGWEAIEAHRYADAVRWLTEASRLAPVDATVWFNLGVAQQRLGLVRDAAASFERAFRLVPDDPRYRSAYEATRVPAAPVAPGQ